MECVSSGLLVRCFDCFVMVVSVCLVNVNFVEMCENIVLCSLWLLYNCV